MQEIHEVHLLGDGPDGTPIRVRVDQRGYVIAGPALTSVHNGILADVTPAVAAHAHLRLVGFACRESASSAAAATFRLINGETVQAPEVTLPIELSANQSTGDWFGDGIACPSGITIDIIAGTIDLIIYYKVG